MTAAAQRASRLGFTLLVFGTAVLLFVRNPLQNPWLPPCFFHKLTGFDCPGCGTARGIHHLLHGEWLQSVDQNLLLIPGLLVLTLGFFHAWTGRGTVAWNYINKPWIVLGIVLTFWLVRNLPWWPFSWLGAGVG